VHQYFCLLSPSHSIPTEGFYFQKSASFTHPRRIYNVVPGDFTHDGMLDLLVMSESSTRNQLDMFLYVGSRSGRFGTSPLSVPPSSLSQPIPIDTNGDMKIDLLGIPSRESSFKVWQNVWNASQPHSPLFDLYVISRSIIV
jgi:integrin alpha FG-GAP repeat containing protein 1